MNEEAVRSLLDVIDFCTEIEELMVDISIDQLREQRLLHLSIERLLEISGEAFNRALRIEPELRESISDARRLIGIRNRLAHDYDNIRLDIVFETATLDIPEIRNEIVDLLTKSGDLQ